MTETRGRKPGYKHSKETRDKIRQSLEGVTHSQGRKESISDAKVLSRCERRLEELQMEYPEQEKFFEDNRLKLIPAMQDIRSNKELDHIQNFVETARIHPDEPYQYSSSSCYAAEDAVIRLLDFKRSIQKYH